METIQIHINDHNGEDRIFLKANYNSDLNRVLKQQVGIKWSSTKKEGYLPVDEELYGYFHTSLQNVAIIKDDELKSYFQKKKFLYEFENRSQPPHSKTQIIPPPINEHILPALKETLVLKAYSPSTIKIYLNEVSQFLKTLNNHPADALNTNQIKKYLQYCFEKLNLSENSMHSRMNALKFYYEQVLKREKLFWDIPRPKKPIKNVTVFSESEVTKIINAIINLKHKAMLMIGYAAGLRISEIVSLRIKDIDSERMILHVRNAKGK